MRDVVSKNRSNEALSREPTEEGEEGWAEQPLKDTLPHQLEVYMRGI